MKKRIFAAFIAAAMSISAFTAFAEYDPNKDLSTSSVATKSVEEKLCCVFVNGEKLDCVQYAEKDGNVLIPLRLVTEKLGFTVEWVGDENGTITLTRGPVYITMSAFNDGYTFSKTAPVMLGTAPWLYFGVTYVPTNFIDEILGGASRINEDGSVDIFDAEHKDVALIESIDAENKQITVNDIVRGKVVLNLPADATISDEEAKPVKFEDLKEGMTLRVYYSEMMTRSLPPQNTPNSIVVLSGSPAVTLPADEEVETFNVAVVANIDMKENTITVNDTILGEVVLVVSDETKITDAEGKDIKLADLKEGNTVEVVYGPAMTMSLPPINNPISVKVTADKSDVEVQPVEKTPVYTE